MGAFSFWHFAILIVTFLLIVLPTWRILSRLGFPGVLGVLVLVPVVNIGLLVWVAYSKWPIERR